MAALRSVMPVALADVVETVPHAILVIKGAALLAQNRGSRPSHQTAEQLDIYKARYAKQPRCLRAFRNQVALRRRHQFLPPRPRAGATVGGLPPSTVGPRDTCRLDIRRDNDVRCVQPIAPRAP